MMSDDHVPVVLIHGVGLDHEMWRPVMTALPNRRTVAYDMIGHGSAPKPDGPYTLDLFVEQLTEIVTALGIAVDLVGFSMGALVAEGFAASASGAQIRRLVLLNGVHRRDATERAAIIERVAEVSAGQYAATIEPALQRWFTPTFAAAHPEVVDAVRHRLLANDERSYVAAYDVFATADEEVDSLVSGIRVPTLVATGQDDPRSTPAMAATLADELPHGRALVLPGLRHLTPLEAPAVVATLIDDFTRSA